jgi:hypothetical protein
VGVRCDLFLLYSIGIQSPLVHILSQVLDPERLEDVLDKQEMSAFFMRKSCTALNLVKTSSNPVVVRLESRL